MANNFLSGLFGKKKNKEDAPASDVPETEGADGVEAQEPAAPPQEPEPGITPEATEDAVAEPSVAEETQEDLETPEPPASVEASTEPAPEAQDDDILPARSEAPAPEKKKGWLSRLKAGLSRSSEKLTEGVTAIFTKRKLDDDTLEELTDLLITADLGVPAATRVTEGLARDKFDKDVTDEEVRTALATEVASTLRPLEKPLAIDKARAPHILLMVGVNGAGKTTTIGKLARKFRDDGLSVMLAAGDTFRAAAIEQLEVWGERSGVPVISRKVGSDAAGLVFDAVKEAKANGIDVLMIDTAGRLQNKKELMDELAKIVRVIKKHDETGPHDVILTLDATVGQNALSQADAFSQIAGVTGLVMTKLDGTARGGVLVALADKFGLPIHYIGVGESVDDLEVFNADQFANALAGIARA
ncbi:signal recognition particle-docking protein FtsY [Hyphococcus sp. DH-69]|uniref:signal recognition particle-docking protein FtsY n=1 Tax=Hyphococcus formosus TaxID=3143534 RepID=UPI00398A691D